MKGIAAGAALLLLLSGTSYAQIGDPARGSTLYHTTYKCTACHGDPPAPTYPPDKFMLSQGTTAAGILAAIPNVPDMLKYIGTLDQSPQDLADLAAYIATLAPTPPPPPTSATADVVEYYYAAFDHYFITVIPPEIAALDNGTFPGWVRTGLKFKAYLPPSPAAAVAASAPRIEATAPPAGTAPMCRFFSTAFAPKSSHFYTYSVDECATVKTYPEWSYEGIVMYVYPANPDGTCPAGQVPVWRLYNNGMGGAPNHRYTADAGQRDLMVAKGYGLEGNGPGFAFMCTPG
jgi:mono/diheme cytochrome c family protein